MPDTVPPAPDYYSRRAEQERAAAERTTDDMARRVHAELAERYAALVAVPVNS